MRWQQITEIVPCTWGKYSHKRNKHLKFYVSPSKRQFAFFYDNSIYGHYLEKANPVVTKIYLKIFTKRLDKNIKL